VREAVPVKRAALLTLLLSACTSMGSGSGFSAQGNESVNFSWKSDDGSGTSGQMSATLADGRIFSGDYLEITHQTASAQLDPLWN
jgi:major membrane immunogen (membrane-anchored lipoprotein)